MTKTLEQAVGEFLKAMDESRISIARPVLYSGVVFDKEGYLIDNLRAAYHEREKRLPYQIILENGLAKIEQRLERIEEIVHEKESSEEREGQKEARTGEGLCEHESSL